MVQVTQTDDEIKITIELNRLITRKPDIVLLPFYLKFNTPPIFFERHLTHEIDETASFCRIFKNEARIVLKKKQKGVWPELFQKLAKDELMKRRLEISDQIIERNKERDQQALVRYEQKRRAEIEKEVRRETAMRDRVKQYEENACRETLMVGTHKQRPEFAAGGRLAATAHAQVQVQVPAQVPALVARTNAVAAVRNSGKINFQFSNFKFNTPKRESQENIVRPFTIHDNVPPTPKNVPASVDTPKEGCTKGEQ